MNYFPTIKEMGLEVEYNYAGIAYVDWLKLKLELRKHGWEQMFIAKIPSTQPVKGGFVAEDVEEILKDIKERKE